MAPDSAPIEDANALSLMPSTNSSSNTTMTEPNRGSLLVATNTRHSTDTKKAKMPIANVGNRLIMSGRGLVGLQEPYLIDVPPAQNSFNLSHHFADSGSRYGRNCSGFVDR